jgi:predicted nucleotidyltransferase
MRYGLSEQTIEKICGVFASHPAIDKAVLYGSRAKGNFKPGSDIDLCLYGAGLFLSELGDISFELDDLLLPYMIDLLIFDQLKHPGLLEHIKRVGVVFYKRQSLLEP